MTTTTQVNRDNVLLRLDGVYNYEIHSKLTSIIHNIAVNKQRTNQCIILDDLKQEAWVRIFEVIHKNLEKNIELEIAYLISVAQTTILGYCQKYAKKSENIDAFASTLMSSSDNGSGEGNNQLNVAKAKLEYELSLQIPSEEKRTVLRLSLEDILENLENDLVKNLIIIRYIKEFNGMSKKINDMYINFYNSIDDERKAILDNMDKYTSNAAFRALNMRATDNSSTKIRQEVKEVLRSLIDN